jgi:Arc/MetJ-type ribon-helix-helix transcriptional regulator
MKPPDDTRTEQNSSIQSPREETAIYYQNAIISGEAMETTLTIKFRGIEAELLEDMIKSGLFASKSEAIRSAIIKYAIDLGMIKRRYLWDRLNRLPRRKVSPEQLQKDIERIEDET